MSMIIKKFITNNAVDGTKIRLSNNEFLRSRNAADSGDINILKVNAQDKIEFASLPVYEGNELATQSYVDAAIADIPAVDLTGYYTKTETDSAIADAIAEIPAVDLSDYYDKGEVDGLLADKANASALSDYLKHDGSVALTGDLDVAAHSLKNVTSVESEVIETPLTFVSYTEPLLGQLVVEIPDGYVAKQEVLEVDSVRLNGATTPVLGMPSEGLMTMTLPPGVFTIDENSDLKFIEIKDLELVGPVKLSRLKSSVNPPQTLLTFFSYVMTTLTAAPPVVSASSYGPKIVRIDNVPYSVTAAPSMEGAEYVDYIFAIAPWNEPSGSEMLTVQDYPSITTEASLVPLLGSRYNIGSSGTRFHTGYFSSLNASSLNSSSPLSINAPDVTINASSLYLPMGLITVSQVTGLLDPAGDTDAANKKYVDDAITAIPAPDLSPYLKKDGSVGLSDHWDVGNYRITGLFPPQQDTDASTKKYVDDSIAAIPAPDLTGYYTKTETDLLLVDKADAADLANYILASEKGAIDGIAPLDANGLVSAQYLPSYVDDVLEVADFASLPAEGEAGKIYITLDDNKVFRWSGSTYIEIVSSPGSTDEVAEGVINLYFTDARARAAAVVNSTAGSETDQAASVSAMKGFVASEIAAIPAPDLSAYLKRDGSASLTGSLVPQNTESISLGSPIQKFEDVHAKYIHAQTFNGASVLLDQAALVVGQALDGNTKTLLQSFHQNGLSIETTWPNAPIYIQTADNLEEGSASAEIRLKTGLAETRGNVVVDAPELDVNFAKVTNVAAPTADTDAANKKYVDDAVTSIPAPDLSAYLKQDGTVRLTGVLRPLNDNTTDLGANGSIFRRVYSSQFRGSEFTGNGATTGATPSVSFGTRTSDEMNQDSGDVVIQTGRSDGSASGDGLGTGKSGDLILRTGATAGTKGKAILEVSELDVNGVKITNLADGTLATDAVNKGQLDAAIAAVSIPVATVERVAVTVQNVTDKKVTLAHTPIANTLIVTPIGGLLAEEGVDYIVTGNEVSWTGLTFDGLLDATDKLVIQYSYNP